MNAMNTDRAKTIARAALVSLLLAAPPALPAAAASVPDYARALSGLAAHHAVYALSFGGSDNADVLAATGTMNYDVLDSCDGWATQQRLIMDVTNRHGEVVHMVSDYSTWEAKDGSKLRFHVRQTTNAEITSEIAGEADEDRATGGTIRYTEPAARTVKLAPGVLFPMAHTGHIVAMAESGAKFLSLPLFDGSSDKGAEDTFIVVTANQKPGPAPFPALAPLPSDRVNISFFDHSDPPAEAGEQPDYAVAMQYWSNGVADALSMDFGDFRMNGKLVSFRPAPHPC